MALQVNGYSSQAQLASVNPFQQRGDEQSSRIGNKDSSLSQAATRPASTSAAQSQKTNLVQTAVREQDDNTTQTKSSQQRGSLVDLSV